MSVRKRLITVLTFNNGILFRTKEFHPDYRYTLNFVDAWSVDEIVLLDITRRGEGERRNFYEVVETFASRCFVPLAVGGYVTTVDDFKKLLSIGADKVIVNTEAMRRPEFITEAARLYGAQCVVVSVDAVKRADREYEVVIDRGTEPTGMSPHEWAAIAEKRGAGEIMIQSVELDGSLNGYDNELNRSMADAISVPLLVNTGAGNWSHFAAGFNEGGAAAVCTSNIYHFTESSVRSAKRYLARAGIAVRTE